MKAIYRPDVDAHDLNYGEYTITHDGTYLWFMLPKEADTCDHFSDLRMIKVNGAGAWTMHSLDPLTITPSIWINKGAGKENGEWHGYITNGEFKEC